MTRLTWDVLRRTHEDGLSNGVLYSDTLGVAWNGLISVNEKETSTLDTTNYFEGQLLVLVENFNDFEATLEAFTYPEEFEEHSGYGSDESNKRFGLSYRTQSSSSDKIHLVYNALVRSSNRSWKTISNTFDLSSFVWDIYTSSIVVPGSRPTSHLIIDTASFPHAIATIEDWLYGTATTAPRLPTPSEIVTLFETETTLQITYNGDGTWTATGPTSMVYSGSNGQIYIASPSAVLLNNSTFVVSSI